MEKFIERNVQNAVAQFKQYYSEPVPEEVLEKYFRDVLTAFTEGFMIEPQYYDTLLPVTVLESRAEITSLRTTEKVYLTFNYRYDDYRNFIVRVFDGFIAIIPDFEGIWKSPVVVVTQYETVKEDIKTLIHMAQSEYYIKPKKPAYSILAWLKSIFFPN